jgi:hypothetical protein
MVKFLSAMTAYQLNDGSRPNSSGTCMAQKIVSVISSCFLRAVRSRHGFSGRICQSAGNRLDKLPQEVPHPHGSHPGCTIHELEKIAATGWPSRFLAHHEKKRGEGPERTSRSEAGGFFSPVIFGRNIPDTLD